MDWPTMEQELAAAKHEIQTLRGKLNEKEEAVHGMEMDLNFHALKAEELEDILAEKNPEEFQHKLQLKAVQNAGLTVQVQELRRQLDEASFKRFNTETELKQAMDKIQRLTDERKSHQRMLVEMGDVVRLLGQIDIDYTKVCDDPSSWTNHERTLDNIKRKIYAIEEDRQNRIQENQELQTELFEKSIELDSYKKEACLLEAVNKDRDRLTHEKEKLEEALKTKDTLIESLQLSLSLSTRKSPGIPKNVMYEQFIIHKQSDQPDMEVVLQDDGSTVVVTSTENISRITNDPAHADDSTKRASLDDDICSFSSLESPDIEPKVLSESPNEQPNAEVEKLETELEKLKKELETTRVQVKTTKKKQELREKLLRDVIFQYKQLQKEHDTATARLAKIGQRDGTSVGGKNHQRPRKGKSQKSTHKTPKNGSLQESPTFDTVESSGVSLRSTHSQAATVTTGSTVDSSTGRSGSAQSDTPIPSFTESEYRQLEKECSRLEHEYEDAVARIANLDDDLTKTKEDLSHALSKNLEKQNELIDLQHKYDYLDADYKAAMEKTSQLEDDLEHAQEQANQARKKRDHREQDLWDVIDQYKKLAEENEHTVAKMQGVETQLGQTRALMASVEHELALTKRHTKRNDLIYENIRMEQQLEDYKIQIEELERDLKIARSEAARSKEDSKSLRNRLAGCNFHFKQLQAQHDDIMTQKANMERDLNKAERHLKLREAQLYSWTEKVSSIREQKQEATIQNRHLMEENMELKAYCNELLQLTNPSMDALSQ